MNWGWERGGLGGLFRTENELHPTSASHWVKKTNSSHYGCGKRGYSGVSNPPLCQEMGIIYCIKKD